MFRHDAAKENSDIAKALNRDIKAYCRKHNYSQEYAAAILGENPGTLSNYVCGNSQVPCRVVRNVMTKLGQFRAVETMLRQDNNQELRVTIADLREAVGGLAREAGEAINKLLADAEDGHIDDLPGALREVNDVLNKGRQVAAITCALANYSDDGRCATLTETQEG